MGFVFENLLIRDCRYCTCKCNASGCSSNILAACQGADWEAFGAQHYLALFTLAHILLLPSLPPRLTQFSTSSLETEEKKITSSHVFLKYSEVPLISVGSLHMKG